MKSIKLLPILILLFCTQTGKSQIPLYYKNSGDTVLRAIYDTAIHKAAMFYAKIGNKEFMLFGCVNATKVMDMSMKDSVFAIVFLTDNGVYFREFGKIVNDTVISGDNFQESVVGFYGAMARHNLPIYKHISMPDPYHIYCTQGGVPYLITFDAAGFQTSIKL